MKNFVWFSVLILFLSSCNGFKEKTKETINNGGETVGKTATEFFEGVSEGVDKTLQCELRLSKDLSEKGLKTGKFLIANDSLGNENNVVSLYLIFEKDFKGTVQVKVTDKNGLESGRVKTAIEGKAGEGKYYDFIFDKRANIEVKSKITIE
jgi:hypothetical protein